jgi:hypothetical protein
MLSSILFAKQQFKFLVLPGAHWHGDIHWMDGWMDCLEEHLCSERFLFRALPWPAGPLIITALKV